MDDNFLRWHTLKSDINQIEKPIFFKEREVWWCYLGQNVGHEQNGKSEQFLRPVLIIKKFNNLMCWVLPLSSKIKTDIYRKQIIINGQANIIMLSQIKTISFKRFKRKVGVLGQVEFHKVITELIKLFPH